MMELHLVVEQFATKQEVRCLSYRIISLHKDMGAAVVSCRRHESKLFPREIKTFYLPEKEYEYAFVLTRLSDPEYYAICDLIIGVYDSEDAAHDDIDETDVEDGCTHTITAVPILY